MIFYRQKICEKTQNALSDDKNVRYLQLFTTSVKGNVLKSKHFRAILR